MQNVEWGMENLELKRVGIEGGELIMGYKEW